MTNGEGTLLGVRRVQVHFMMGVMVGGGWEKARPLRCLHVVRKPMQGRWEQGPGTWLGRLGWTLWWTRLMERGCLKASSWTMGLRFVW